ncbi:MAG: type II toxin-antitoxin system HicA family toxin [Ignavibacteriae bacterium]|nr:type II toxin-antitoxin system HicA family toxin [Ignavibacteriota bacterium]MCB9214613.1 type II toxin-antitoxin system HicA family toxin [Ignavibacteria bacterium]
MSHRLSNVSLQVLRKYLQQCGCEYQRAKGGHEKWVKDGFTRPIVLQSHIDPVPERIVKQCLSLLGVSRKEFERALEEL